MRRRSKDQEHPQHERWLVSYADFMTLLFALFVVLFASSHHDKTSIKKVSTAVRDGFQEMGTFSGSATIATGGSRPTRQTGDAGVDLLELQQKLNKALGKEIARQEVGLRMTPEGFVISLHELGFFDSGQAQLLPGAEEPIKRIAGVLMQYGLDMRVEGHSDDIPIHNATFASNWDLSTARATAVAMMLLNESKFDPTRMSIAGYAQYHPAASNDTVEGRRANRRVDIVIVSATGPTPITVRQIERVN
jgi:chemotaxis protein MotB